MITNYGCVATYGRPERDDLGDEIAAKWSESGCRVVDTQLAPHGYGVHIYCFGDEASVERGALASAMLAAKEIDVSPRPVADHVIGSTHSLVVSPYDEATMESSVELARRVGRQAALELGVPVYLFGRAAGRPSRVDLTSIAAGGYTALRSAIESDPAHEPDFGPDRLGSAGAMAIGVAEPVLALELRLPDDRLDGAEAVAAALDGRSGGLAFVRSEVGGAAHGRPTVWVSLQDCGRDTPLYRLMELARSEARRRGTNIVGAALHGLVPASVLHESAVALLRIDPPRLEQVLLPSPGATAPATGGATLDLRTFVDRVASDEATPGGGSVAALVGALGAALTAMAAGITLRGSKVPADDARMQRLRRKADDLQQTLLGLVDEDAEAFGSVMAAYRLPRDTAESTAARRDAIQVALRRATDVPLSIMQTCVEVLRIAHDAAEHGSVHGLTDAGVAGYLAHAAARSASLNVAVNVTGLRDLDEGDKCRAAGGELLSAARALADEVERLVDGRIKA